MTDLAYQRPTESWGLVVAPQIDALAPFLSPVPEPATWLLLALAGIFLFRIRKDAEEGR